MPNPTKFPERFQTWVSLLGGKLETPEDYKFYKKMRICDIHFSDEYKNRNKRLSAIAVPTLHMPGSSLDFAAPVVQAESNIPAAVPQISAASTSGSSLDFPAPVQAESNILAAVPQISAASTSGVPQTVSTFVVTDHNYCRPIKEFSLAEPMTDITNLPSTSVSHHLPGPSRSGPVDYTEFPESSGSTCSTSNENCNARTPMSTFVAGSSLDFPAPVQAESNILAAVPQISAASTSGTSSSVDFPAPVQAECNIPAASTSGSCVDFTVLVQATRTPESKNLTTTQIPSTSDAGSRRMNPMQKKIKYLCNEICRLRKRGQSFKKRLADATKLSNNIAFERVVKNMTKPAQLFVHMQLQSTKKAKGRRFTLQENILAASLFKKSPKSYRLLCKYFTLPSPNTMRRILSQIKLSAGINNIIFAKIKNTVQEKDSCDRLCTLMFDEMSITPQVTYNAHEDKFEGFACNAENAFADHALVFMVKGVKSNFKQPIAYYFTNSLTKYHLKDMIKAVVQHTIEAGLIVVSTVCDQGAVNVGAINELINDTKALYLRLNKQWRHDIIRLNKHNIIPLYDTPHIIKGLRNNLMTKDLSYTINGETKIVKWDYFQMVYAADKSYGELRLLDKLTEEHINPEKIHKMRVKSATQLFSHSVCVAAEHLTARGDLPNECRQLIDFTLMIDNVFDSLNVSTLHVPNGKIYKGPVKQNSPHHQLWQKAKEMLKTAKYIKSVKVGNKIRLTETAVPSITNLIKTIEGIESLWKLLRKKYGMDAMLTRNLNQDPVENFFGSIRSYGVRNTVPNTVAFEGAFKALMLNNISSTHSIRANCEEDQNECLQNFEFFLTETIPTSDTPKEKDIIHFNNEIFSVQSHENDAGQSNYVCGWVLKKCLKNIIKSCQHCRLHLLYNKDKIGVKNTFIKAKEYQNKAWLCYPSEEVANYFNEIQNIVTSFLKKNVPKTKIKENILILLDIFTNDPFSCPEHNHKLKKYFNDTSINVLIYSWCRSVNRILSGKIKYDGEDEVKKAAQNYYNKHKNYKNRK